MLLAFLSAENTYVHSHRSSINSHAPQDNRGCPHFSHELPYDLNNGHVTETAC